MKSVFTAITHRGCSGNGRRKPLRSTAPEQPVTLTETDAVELRRRVGMVFQKSNPFPKSIYDNAIKYGGENGTIEIAIERADHSAVVRVTDHGEGIAAEERERIFRRFYRIDKSRSQDVSGVGLGLAITKHLVLLHGGSIDVESEPGMGATFVVTLPLATRGAAGNESETTAETGDQVTATGRRESALPDRSRSFRRTRSTGSRGSGS